MARLIATTFNHYRRAPSSFATEHAYIVVESRLGKGKQGSDHDGFLFASSPAAAAGGLGKHSAGVGGGQQARLKDLRCRLFAHSNLPDTPTPTDQQGCRAPGRPNCGSC